MHYQDFLVRVRDCRFPPKDLHWRLVLRRQGEGSIQLLGRQLRHVRCAQMKWRIADRENPAPERFQPSIMQQQERRDDDVCSAHLHMGSGALLQRLGRKRGSGTKGSLKRQATSGSDAESLAQVTSEAGRRIAISTDSRRKGCAALLASGARVPPILCALLVLPNHLALSR